MTEEKYNFVKFYERSFREHWDQEAVTDYGTDKTLTYGELAITIAKLHILFEECGIKKNDKIAYLTAFIELKEDNGLSGLKNGIAIKKELGQLIPSYMVPRNIKIVKEFPTNVNGKIDRKKLLEEV